MEALHRSNAKSAGNQWGTEEDWREIPDRIELAPGAVIEIPRPRITSALDALPATHKNIRTSTVRLKGKD
jgi:hypothetical protein